MLKIETSVNLQYNLNELFGLVVKDVRDQYGLKIKQNQVGCLYYTDDDDNYDEDDAPTLICLKVHFTDEQKRAIIKHNEKPGAPPQANLIELNSKWSPSLPETHDIYRFVGMVYDDVENTQNVVLKSVKKSYDVVVISQQNFNTNWKKVVNV